MISLELLLKMGCSIGIHPDERGSGSILVAVKKGDATQRLQVTSVRNLDAALDTALTSLRKGNHGTQTLSAESPR